MISVTTTLAPTIALTHGAHMPVLGLGTWPLKGDGAAATIADALDAGYRLIDTAFAYGNEDGVGRGIKASPVPRDDVFVTTKFNKESHSVAGVHKAFADSARALGVDYIDLMLIHWPNPAYDHYVDAWRGLIELLEAGDVRAIGLSNFKPAHIDRILAETGVVPDVNQIQLNPGVTREGPRAYHAEHGIVTESYSPLGPGSTLLTEPVITDLAQRYGRSAGQIVLRWHIELGLVAIPKSGDPGRLRANIDIFDFALTPDDVAAISSLDKGEAAATDSDTAGH
jgi:2,5-diketo-D-gluconate reductase A